MPTATAGRADPARLVILVIVLMLAVHAVLAAVMGFTFDESYDLVMARNLALSYRDHPPAIMWLIAAAVRLFGSEHHFVVRLPTLLLAAAQSWLLYRLTALLFSPWAGFFAVIAFCLSPLFGLYFGMIAVTDGPLLFALTGAALFVARALSAKRPVPWADWLFAGLFFGLAMISKISAILVLPGLALFLVTEPRYRRLFSTPAPYLAALVALAVFTPVMAWNYEHGFVAFAFQGGRTALGASVHLKRTLIHLGHLIAVIGIAGWLVQIAALVGALRAGPRDEARWFFAMLAIVPIGFFLALDLFGVGGVRWPHWQSPGYLFTFPLLGAAVARWRPRYPRTVRWTIAANAGVIALVVVGYYTQITIGWMQNFVPDVNKNYDTIDADSADWWSFRASLAKQGFLDPSRYFVLAGRYGFCFKAQVVLNNAIPVACLSDNPIVLTLWRDDAALQGHDAIIITTWWRWRESLAAIRAKFEHVRKLPPVWIIYHGRPVQRVELLLGQHLKEPLLTHPEAAGHSNEIPGGANPPSHP